MAFKGHYTRGYLPHHDVPGQMVGITFRLFDSVPSRLLRAFGGVLDRTDTVEEADDVRRELRIRLERYLARGKGSKLLEDARAATIVEEVLHEGDPRLYRLLAWVVMPNHVHVLIRRTTESTLPLIVQRWKSWSAHRINRIMNRSGPVWYRDYFDRDIRVGDDDLQHAISYIETNPVKAGLCSRPQDWPHSSAWVRLTLGPNEVGRSRARKM